jgi:DNA-binding transcriptional LysR family regulator
VEITGLKYLYSVAEAGSFAAAARTLNLHVSTLSRQIFALENELGVTIFERGHSGIRLTSSGQAVLIYVRQVLADLDALANVSQLSGNGKNGHVHLGVGFPLINDDIKKFIFKWHHFHPSVGFTLHEMTESDLVSFIKDRHIDAAILTEHTLWSDAASEPICTERIFAAISTSHAMAKHVATTWKAIRKEIVLVQDWPHSHVTRSFYASLLGPSTRFISHPAGKQSLFSLVAAGFGITLATEGQASIGFPGVTFIPIDEDNAVIRHVLAWLPQCEDPAVGRFVAFMRDEARSLRTRNP